MPDFLLQVGKILFPGASDQEIASTIQEIRQADPKATDEEIVLEVLTEFMSGQKGV